MFKFLFSALLFLPLLATANYNYGKYEQSEKTDGTLIYQYTTVADDVIAFIADARYNPKKHSWSDLTFYISFDEKKHQYMNCGQITWVVDGNELDLAQRSTKNSTAYFALLTKKSLAQFANADNVQLTVCGHTYKMTEYDLDGINRVYTDYMKNF